MAFLDFEPNDSFSQATRLAPLNGSLLINGELGNGSGNDIFDFYRFTINQPSKFAATLASNGNTNANILLLNSNNGVIDISSNPAGSLDTVEADILQPGEYVLQVNKASGGPDFDYSVSTLTTPIERAQLSVTVDRLRALERFDTPVPFTRFGEADFRVQARFDGRTRTRQFSNDDDIRTPFTLSSDVDVNAPFVSVILDVEDNDPDFNDIVDINPNRGLSSLIISYDVETDRLFGTGQSFARSGQSITVQGGAESRFFLPPPGFGEGDARITYRVNYNTFSSSASASRFRAKTPITFGTRSSDFLRGRDRGGILDGGRGRDEVLGMGGDDALMGGKGNDSLDGGTGDDIIHGGPGRDRSTGGLGRDVFVIGPGFGVNVITDYKDGRDKIGLPFGISSELLDIKQRGNRTILGVGRERFAILKGVEASAIDATDFVDVDFTRFGGMDVPTLL